MQVSFIVNQKPVTVEAPENMKLADVLRDILGLMGTKVGCEIGVCGSCSVLMDGELVFSCTIPVKKVQGCRITTIEGIHAPDGGPNDLQQALLDAGAVQCGYCTPGMVMAGEALLARTLTPTRQEIRQAIAHNLCRCTGYQQIVDAIEATAAKRSLERSRAQSQG